MELGPELPEKPRAPAGLGFSRQGLRGPFEFEQLGEQVIQGEDGSAISGVFMVLRRDP